MPVDSWFLSCIFVWDLMQVPHTDAATQTLDTARSIDDVRAQARALHGELHHATEQLERQSTRLQQAHCDAQGAVAAAEAAAAQRVHDIGEAAEAAIIAAKCAPYLHS
jgi:F0F1-type ATP synthase membrane subunit b/b'